MPVFEVTAPDGKKLRVTAPEGATQEQALAKAREMYRPEGAQQAPKAQDAPKRESSAVSGMKDALDLGAAYIDARTFNLGPKIGAALGVLPAKLAAEGVEAVTGNEAPSMADIYKKGVDMYSAPGKRAFENHPVLAAGMTLAGGYKTAKDLGGTETAKRLGNWAAKGGGWPAVGKRAALASGLGEAGYRAVKVGAAAPGEEGKELVSGIPWGGITGGALSLMGSGITGAASKLKGREPVVNYDKLKEMSQTAYKKADQSGASLKPQFVDDFIDHAQSKLVNSDEVIRNMKANKPLLDAFDDISAFKGQPMTLQRVKALDETLGDMVESNTNMGRMNALGKRLKDLQMEFRSMVADADPSLVDGGKEGFQALKEGRDLWSASLRMRDIDDIIQKASQTDNPAGSLKTQFRTLYNNKKRMRGYTEAEREAIKKVAEGGPWQDLLRTFGSRLTSIIGLSSGAGPAGTAALTIGSKGARTAAEMVQQNKARMVQELISQRGAPVQQLPVQYKPGSLTQQLMAGYIPAQATTNTPLAQELLRRK